MLEELFTSVSTGDITFGLFLACIVSALFCGALIAVSASIRSEFSRSLFLCELLLPPIVSILILMINGSIGAGIAVAGAFSLVRFRSAPGKAKDIVAIFLSMTAGIACATGYIAISIIFTVIICAVIVAFTFVPIKSEGMMDLKITIPENLNFNGVFDGVMKKYTKKSNLVSIKTSNMGSMYKLFFKVEMKDRNQIQEFIDEIRTLNANLEVSVMDSQYTDKTDEL